MGKRSKNLVYLLFGCILVIALLLTACGGNEDATDTTTTSESGDNTTVEDKGTVTLLSWGGSIERAFFELGMAEEFKKQTGYTLELIPKSGSAAIMEQALVQKDNPQVDVVMCDNDSHILGHDEGIWTPLAEMDVPNTSEILESCVEDDYINVYFDVTGLIYNKDVFAEKGWDPPTSQDDLIANAKEWSGHIAMESFPSAYSNAYMMNWALEAGGGYDNTDAAFEKLAQLAPHVYEFVPNMSQLEDWFASGDVYVASYASVVLRNIQSKGVNAEFVMPSEGSYIIPTSAAVMKNCPNPEGAAALLNFLISNTYQDLRYNTFGNIPANKNIELDPNGGLTWDKLADARKLDPAQVKIYRPQWVDRFNLEIAPIEKAF